MTHDTLERLEAAWQRLDRRARVQEEDDLLLSRSSRVRSVRRSLWPFAAGQTLQVLVGLALMIPAYAVETRADAGILEVGSALVLHVYAVAIIAWAIATLVLISRLDPSLPVFKVQERLLRLRRAYLAGSFVLGLVWWALWLPFLTVLSAWLGLAGYMEHLGPALPWMLAVSIAGFAGTLILTALARRRPLLRDRLLTLLSGGRLLDAEEELRVIIDIRREQSTV